MTSKPTVPWYGPRLRSDRRGGTIVLRRFGTATVLVLTTAICGFTADRGLVGTWRFEKEVDTLADRTEVPPSPAAGYQGLLVLTAGGRFVGSIVPRGRQWRIDTVPADELRRSLSATDASFGTYRFDPSARTFTYHPEGSLDPSIEGTDIVRSYTLSGDTLVLSGNWEYEGTQRRFQITWKRVE
jgi:hypothetical protein